ncbi:NAD(P)H-dependent oxidoreductase [Pseudoalteromonas sp. T1lg65]|uniref:NAD(P)H-dependent oxidoreductase n=1 Tax=Pseudoalteromonas sp. T1lg65 TaxID=2077101 RepID=UPI003F79A31B
MKVMNLVFHPNLASSNANRIWKQQLEASGKLSTSRDMYAEYPDFVFDVEKEQQLLLEHDRIIFQFPLYWYSVPPLLKKWLDDILAYGFAFGEQGDKLKDKDLQVLVSVGGRAQFYSGFDLFASIPELMKMFQMTANLTQMNYLHPVWMCGATEASEQQLSSFIDQFIPTMDDPRRSDPKQFLYEEVGLSLG